MIKRLKAQLHIAILRAVLGFLKNYDHITAHYAVYMTIRDLEEDQFVSNVLAEATEILERA